MRRTALAAAGVCAAVLGGLPATTSANGLLVNGDFETATAIGSGLPGGVGSWSGDYSGIVTASDGITPYEGTRMLKFIYTAPGGQASGYWSSDVYQLIDLTPYAALIAPGTAVAAGSIRFNRVAGDAETDTQFSLVLRAYAGSPSTFPAQVGNTDLVWDRTNVYTDSDPGTWETAGLQLGLPAATDFLCIQILSGENVHNDSTGVEFDGHYADAAAVMVVPEPGALALLGLGSAAIARRRRRRGSN